jgi:hypothetical protein
MLTAPMTMAHFSVSSTMNFPNSADKLGKTAAPKSPRYW